MTQPKKEIGALREELHDNLRNYREASSRELKEIRFVEIIDTASAIIAWRTRRKSLLLEPEHVTALGTALIDGLKSKEKEALQLLVDAISAITFKIGIDRGQDDGIRRH